MLTQPPTVTVRLKDGTTYHGLYRVKVDHLPLNCAAELLIVLVFGVTFGLLVKLHGPDWATWFSGYFTATFFLGLLRDSFRLLRQTSR